MGQRIRIDLENFLGSRSKIHHFIYRFLMFIGLICFFNLGQSKFTNNYSD